MAPPLRPQGSRTLPSEELGLLLFASLREVFDALEHVDITFLRDWLVIGVSLFNQEELPKMKAVVEKVRTMLLERSYAIYDGNITHMARALGSNRRTVRHWLEKTGVREQPASGVLGYDEVEFIDEAVDEAEFDHQEVESEGLQPSDGVPIDVESSTDDEDAQTHPIHVADDDE